MKRLLATAALLFGSACWDWDDAVSRCKSDPLCRRGGATTPPGAPTDVVAVEDIRAAHVSWTAPQMSGSSDLVRYTVTPRPSGTPVTVLVPATSADVTGLQNGTTYTFDVVASNATDDGPAGTSSPMLTPDVPSAPESVQATSGNRSALVQWAPPVSDGRRPIERYNVSACCDAGTVTVDAGVTSATVAGLQYGAAYTFTVTASNAVGDGPASASTAPVNILAVPEQPTAVKATPLESAARVEWAAPVDVGGSPLLGFTVTTNPGGATTPAAATDTQLTVPGLVDGTQYTFTVTAKNAFGDGLASSPSNVATPGPAAAPTAVTAVPADSVATVSWTPAADDGRAPTVAYRVTASGDGGQQVMTDGGLMADVTGLTNAQSYTFTVTALNAFGESPSSPPSNAVVPFTVPAAPSGVMAAPGDHQAIVSWTAPLDHGRPITRYTINGCCDAGTALVTDGGTQGIVAGLRNGAAYTFTVTATNAAGDGPVSAPSNVVTVGRVPGAPSYVSAIAGNQRVTVRWSTPDTGGPPITGYTVSSVPAGFMTATTGATEATLNGLANGTAYRFTVRATNIIGTGVPSAPSNPATPAAPCSGQLVMGGVPSIATGGTSPKALVVADFNGDGKRDMAVTNSGSNNVSVFLGNGNTTFGAPTFLTGGSQDGPMATADFNGDGKLDLLVGNPGASTVSVYLGNGNGTFQAGQSSGSGTTPAAFAVGDFNGDTKLDVAVANGSSGGQASLLIGNDAGTFAAPTTITTGAISARAITSADFNGDNKLDVAVGSINNTLSIILGNGNGTFQAPTTIASSAPGGMTHADINGDGKVDLVMNAGILLGNGNGTFGAATTVPGGSAIAVGDLDGDSKLDIAYVIYNPSLIVTQRGNGDGTFQPPQTYLPDGAPEDVALADLTGDGKLELVETNIISNDVQVLVNLGGGSLAGVQTYAVASQTLRDGVTADFNNDGRLDVAVCDFGNAQIQVLFGTASGFSAPSAFGVAMNPVALATTDLNGDGIPDVAVANQGSNSMSVLVGLGDGGFAPSVNSSTGSIPWGVVVGDINRDHLPDVVTVNNSNSAGMSVFFGNGDGTVQSAQNRSASARAVALGDFNGDTALDVAYVWGVTNVLLNVDGGFSAAPTSPIPGTALATGDFNGDGRADLALSDGASTVGVALGNGDGTFAAPLGTVTLPDVPLSIAAGDLNADGLLDIAVAVSGGQTRPNTVSLVYGNGNGTLRTPINISAPTQPMGIFTGDFNADGRLDVAVTQSTGKVNVFLNQVCLP